MYHDQQRKKQECSLPGLLSMMDEHTYKVYYYNTITYGLSNRLFSASQSQVSTSPRLSTVQFTSICCDTPQPSAITAEGFVCSKTNSGFYRLTVER